MFPFCATFVFSTFLFLEPYNGKDVRQAVSTYGLAKAKGGVGYSELMSQLVGDGKVAKKWPKVFENRLNSDGSRPLEDEVKPLDWEEFPIMQDKRKGYDGRRPVPTEARIIMKHSPAETELMGLVGHSPGSNDHKSF